MTDKPVAEPRVARDFARVQPMSAPVVFDVGANVGQSTAGYRLAWPDATIHAFEPVALTYGELERRFAGDAAVVCRHIALGDRAETALVTADATSTMNTLVSGSRARGPVEEIAVETGDAYCRAHGVERIGFLKIDTEGHDLKVLIGFLDALREHRIDYIQVEAGMNPENTRHVSMGRFAGLLEPLGYYLFGVYDQVREKSVKTALRRSNLVFARKTLGA